MSDDISPIAQSLINALAAMDAPTPEACQCEHIAHFTTIEILRGAHTYNNAPAATTVATPYGIYGACEACASHHLSAYVDGETTPEAIAARAWYRIAAEFPAVRTFEALHDECDANAEYLAEAFEYETAHEIADFAICNFVIEYVNARMQEGR